MDKLKVLNDLKLIAHILQKCKQFSPQCPYRKDLQKSYDRLFEHIDYKGEKDEQ